MRHTNGQSEGQMPDRYIDSAPHTIQAVSITTSIIINTSITMIIYAKKITNISYTCLTMQSSLVTQQQHCQVFKSKTMHQCNAFLSIY